MPSKFSNFRTTFKALAPILLNAIKSGQLFKPQCELTEPDPDIICEYDIEWTHKRKNSHYISMIR
ncbi:hypothetical protein D1AOALGA4SA_10778 [Olavius algarvensis Delta 1 endosymbiont]|nr:hypothetical protein D1AOALGA4SA_10778 [Olavius algarvensis Delta 1 endosymbiont]